MRLFVSFFFAVALIAGGAARADFSEEWDAYAAETRAACDAFEAGLPEASGGGPTLMKSGDIFIWPRGAPGRPHVCLYFSVSLDGSGAPEDVQLLFKGPGNLNYKFVRSGIRLIKSRRYEAPSVDETPKPILTRIIVLAEPNSRFRYWVSDIR